MYAELFDWLKEEGDVRIGGAGFGVKFGKLLIKAQETTHMTVNQTIGALIGLDIHEREVDYRTCFGYISTPLSRQSGENIGTIYAHVDFQPIFTPRKKHALDVSVSKQIPWQLKARLGTS